MGYWGAPWYWGDDLAYYDAYPYDSGPDYGPAPNDDNYGQPPPSSGSYGANGSYGSGDSYGAPPPASNNYNCSAWRWDDNAKKYVQVRAACN